jgi:hypothetical protein
VNFLAVRASVRADVGLPWTVFCPNPGSDFRRCTNWCSEVLKERGAYVGRDISEGITLLEGRDPDGLPIMIVYPGAERAPRHVIHDRIRRA